MARRHNDDCDPLPMVLLILVSAFFIFAMHPDPLGTRPQVVDITPKQSAALQTLGDRLALRDAAEAPADLKDADAMFISGVPSFEQLSMGDVRTHDVLALRKDVFVCGMRWERTTYQHKEYFGMPDFSNWQLPTLENFARSDLSSFKGSGGPEDILMLLLAPFLTTFAFAAMIVLTFAFMAMCVAFSIIGNIMIAGHNASVDGAIAKLPLQPVMIRPGTYAYYEPMHAWHGETLPPQVDANLYQFLGLNRKLERLEGISVPQRESREADDVRVGVYGLKVSVTDVESDADFRAPYEGEIVAPKHMTECAPGQYVAGSDAAACTCGEAKVGAQLAAYTVRKPAAASVVGELNIAHNRTGFLFWRLDRVTYEAREPSGLFSSTHDEALKDLGGHAVYEPMTSAYDVLRRAANIQAVKTRVIERGRRET